MKFIFGGIIGTYAEKITVTIEADTEKDAWDILEGFSRFNFSYWSIDRQA